MATFDPTRPYNDLPPLPPSADIESRVVLKGCIEARAALAALNQAGRLIPNQSVLINTLPLMEAQASSEIENIVTTADALFRYSQLDEQAADPATKEALRYRTALREGVESLRDRPLSTSTAVRVCSTIVGREMDIRRIPGTTLTNPATREVVYTPPVGATLLREKLGNWERFIHEHDKLDPLIRMAVAHYQFEAIHPFLDGNGRTGRVLNQVLIVEQGLLDLPILYLSRYIIRSRADYYRLLLAVTTHRAWDEWLAYVLRGVEETATWTTHKIHAIRDLLVHTATYVRERAPKVYSRELVELIFMQPYCRIQNLVEAGLAQRQTASVHLKELCEAGVLREVKAGRDKVFVHPKFIELLMNDEHGFRSYRDKRDSRDRTAAPLTPAPVRAATSPRRAPRRRSRPPR
jgi:Fic family protein